MVKSWETTKEKEEEKHKLCLSCINQLEAFGESLISFLDLKK